MLRFFVYGTLKRGFWNHDRFCRGVLDIREAEMRGRLYEMHSGIPVLKVPDGDVLAHGTSDVLADLSACNAQAGVAAQSRLSEELASYPEPAQQSATAGDCGPVYLSAVPGTAQAGGELLTFDLPAPSEARQAVDPESRLPAIDRLEGFHPGGSSLYRRVLVPACIRQEVVVGAWAYAGESEQRFRRLLLAGRRPS